MKLPFKMTESVTSTLKSAFPNFENYIFATFFVKGLYKANGELHENGIRPRYITIYSDNRQNLEISIFMIKELFGEVFDYDLSDVGAMCESEESTDSVLLHRRSRVVQAETVIAVFKKVEEDKNVALIYDYLLKTNFVLEVKKLEDEVGSSFVARTFFRPSTADIVTDSGIILYPSMSEALNKVLTSPHCPFDEVIDEYFDTVVIDSPELKTEIAPPKNTEELVSLINKSLITT